jgi:hypothetical protein
MSDKPTGSHEPAIRSETSDCSNELRDTDLTVVAGGWTIPHAGHFPIENALIVYRPGANTRP